MSEAIGEDRALLPIGTQLGRAVQAIISRLVWDGEAHSSLTIVPQNEKARELVENVG